MARVEITTGTARRGVDLAGRTVIGRHSAADIHLDDDRVSRQHAEIVEQNGRFILRDLGSGNGTRVNDAAATDHLLNDGDRISIGQSVLVFRSDDFQTRIVRRVPETAGPQMLANLGVLYEAATAISHILDVDELLGKILDLVMGATNADHAAAILVDGGTGELMPRSVRSQSDNSFAFSRTIVDYVREHRQGILINDAAADERFRGGESIVRHSLRQVICVPMRGRHDTVGVLFLDTHKHPFSEDHLNLAVALAHQAALAIEETKYYRALLDSERLAAVGQTIAGMSHHIKNIMQGVRFGGDMIRTGIGFDDKDLISKGWGLVEKNQRRIDALIMDMLSFSKEREPLKEPCDWNTIVLDVLELVRNRNVTIDYTPTPTPIIADADALHAAVLNIVTNAIDALDNQPDGVITILLDGSTLTIDDNGPGVPAEQREAVFQPFVSSKGIRGTGLGLPVSRKILREHGGDLVLSESPRGGARFVFTLTGGHA